MIDSHSHIYCSQFDDDRDLALGRAQQAGITHIVMPNENLESLKQQRLVHQAYPTLTSMTIGLHPEDIDADFKKILDEMEQILAENRNDFVAVGEIGIDLYWNRTWRDQQVEALDMQLRWCLAHDLPFIIHCREGIDEILWTFNNFGTELPPGVMHSFTGSTAEVESLRQYGDFYFGINGIVTFKRSEVPLLLPVVGLNRILLETDSPYLAPVPHRGKRNESSFLPHIAACIANHLGTTTIDVEEATTANAKQLFKLI